MAINWGTLTRTDACRMIPAADKREKALATQFDAGAIEESVWWDAFKVWEDLRVYYICGVKPGDES